MNQVVEEMPKDKQQVRGARKPEEKEETRASTAKVKSRKERKREFLEGLTDQQVLREYLRANLGRRRIRKQQEEELLRHYMAQDAAPESEDEVENKADPLAMKAFPDFDEKEDMPVYGEDWSQGRYGGDMHPTHTLAFVLPSD